MHKKQSKFQTEYIGVQLALKGLEIEYTAQVSIKQFPSREPGFSKLFVLMCQLVFQFEDSFRISICRIYISTLGRKRTSKYTVLLPKEPGFS